MHHGDLLKTPSPLVCFAPCLLSLWCFLGWPHKYTVRIQIHILESPSQNPNLRQDLLDKNHYSHHVLITRHCDKHLESVISLIFTTSLGGRFCLQIGKSRLREGRDVLKVTQAGHCFCLLSWALNTWHSKRFWIIPWDHGFFQKLELQLSSLGF